MKKREEMKPVNDWFGGKIEDELIRRATKYVPRWASSKVLTLMTAVWSLLIVPCYYFAGKFPGLLWAASALVMMQQVTDSLDGAVGRARGEGLVKWGYYADHFLDFVFMSAVFLGYHFVWPGSIYPFLLYIMFSLLFVSSHLKMNIGGELEVALCGVSITEMRWVIIGINALAFFGLGDLLQRYVFIAIFALAALFAIIDFLRTQKRIFNC